MKKVFIILLLLTTALWGTPDKQHDPINHLYALNLSLGGDGIIGFSGQVELTYDYLFTESLSARLQYTFTGPDIFKNSNIEGDSEMERDDSSQMSNRLYLGFGYNSFNRDSRGKYSSGFSTALNVGINEIHASQNSEHYAYQYFDVEFEGRFLAWTSDHFLIYFQGQIGIGFQFDGSDIDSELSDQELRNLDITRGDKNIWLCFGIGGAFSF